MASKSEVIVSLVLVAAVATLIYLAKPAANLSNNLSNNQSKNQLITNNTITNTNGSSTAQLVAPIADANGRITKKPFGIYITPQTSPVQPERFTGYHTGVDFETLPSEQNIDVPIYAVCAGKLLAKEWASGYGGLAVQACQLAGQNVTIIYGHLQLASITATVGQQLAAGQQLGILGKGYSTETDGERKHLHLGIHRDSQRQFSREDKFAVRQILLGMACAIAVLVDETPQKAVSALME